MSQDPRLLAALRSVPSRWRVGLLTFGSVLGLPMVLFCLAGLAGAVEEPELFVLLLGAGVLTMVVSSVMLYVFLFRGRRVLKRAQEALYRGELLEAARDARSVASTVFRGDYQMAAVYTLGLVAERASAFVEAGILFERAIAAVPIMAAPVHANRARVLASAHAALCHAAAQNMPMANVALTRCHGELGRAPAPGSVDILRMDDSGLGAVGMNAQLRDLDSGRAARPFAVLATLVVNYRNGDLRAVHDMLAHEQAMLHAGLAVHELALVERLAQRSWQQLATGAPHRHPVGSSGAGPAAFWVESVIG